MNKLFYLLCSIFVSFYASCDYQDRPLQINNSSDDTIFVLFSTDPSRMKKHFDYNETQYYIERNIPPKDSDNIYLLNRTWRGIINSSPDKTLHLFVYKLDTLNKYQDIDYIVKHNLFVQEFTLAISDLDSLKWQLTYN